MAHARQPLRRRLMMAFQPFWEQKARTRISISDPNCRRRVSWCIMDASAGALSFLGGSEESTRDSERIEDESSRLRIGVAGISSACRPGVKPEIQNTTKTNNNKSVAGVWLGRCEVEE